MFHISHQQKENSNNSNLKPTFPKSGQGEEILDSSNKSQICKLCFTYLVIRKTSETKIQITAKSVVNMYHIFAQQE